MIYTLLELIYVIVVGLMGGVATFWFMSLIGDPDKEEVNTRAIFSFYGVWIRHKYDAYEKALEDRITRRAMNLKEQEKFEARHINWAKSGGACRYCTGVYITAFMSAIIFYCTDVSLWWIFLTLPTFHFSLKHMTEKLD